MKKTTLSLLIILSVLLGSFLKTSPSGAQPYGVGIYDENVPYGDETSLSIGTDGDVTIQITPTAGGVLGTGVSTVTVTSTDVKGYKLYVRALTSTDMNNLGTLIPASSNVSLAPLAVNTWGYNTDNSSNFIGISLTDALLRSVTVPVPSGDITTVMYGLKVDLAKAAGNYAASVIYTAVPQTT